ncbi:hypothetical protein [Falsiroseomonas tokyonensis]|nr:hypothetical protein [Falsiroseomonas tokyonensis]
MSPLLILRAWMLTLMWGWYLVPAFGLEPLRLIYAFGILLILGFLRGRPPSQKDEKFLAAALISLLASAAILGMAWIGTFFI